MRTTPPPIGKRAPVFGLAAAVTLGLMAAVAPGVSAIEVVPRFTYLSTAPGANQYRLFANSADGSGTPTALTPTSYVLGYDVSQDGKVIAASVATRPEGSLPEDTTYGLVVNRGLGTTRVLSSWIGANPVVSGDGSTVWWLAQAGIYKSVAGGPAVLASSRFGSVADTGYPSSLAISPDGLSAAVFTENDESVTVFAARLAAGGATFSKTYLFSSAPFADDSTFVWKDAGTLLFNLADNTGITTVVAATLGVASTTDLGLGAVYGLRPMGSTWYLWRDTATTSEYGSTTDLSVAPSTWVPRSDGPTTTWYVPSAATPPVLTTAANRATPKVTFAVRSPIVSGRRAAYVTLAQYLTPLPGQSGYDALWNFRGTLQYSTNAGQTWGTLRTTTGATIVEFPTSPLFGLGNGLTQALNRNTWFRWVYPGDLLTVGVTSAVRKVVVNPIVTVRVKVRASGTRKVHGTVTRVGGKAKLQRYSSGAWRAVATTTISRTGVYSFGYRTLRRGTYRVIAPATLYFGLGSKKFRI